MPVDLNEEHVILFDSTGVEMAVSNGIAVPVGTRGYVQAGSDGTNVRFRLLDTSGRSLTVGAAAAGAAPVGNPVQVGGSDGAAIRALITDTTGRQIAVGGAAAGAVPAGNPLLVAGSDGAAVRALLTDVGGRQIAVGAAAAAAAPVGNPVLVGGSDGAAVRTRLLDTSGRSITVGAAATGAAVAGNPVLMGGFDGANARTLITDTTGRQIAVGAAASGAAAAGDPVLMAGSDGVNARTLLTDAAGRLAVTSTAGTNGSITGEVSTNAGGVRAAINLTTYTDQSANAQRSVSSSSANDTAAGTGARTIRLTYYSIAAGVVTGPFTETITMNGAAAVNTVSTTIAFVEKIEVITAGSLGVSAGIISIFAATGGGGGAFGTLTAGTNITRWSQHWVPSGRTCSIYSVFIQNTANSGNTPKITIEVFDVAVANAAERPIATYRIDGRTNMALGAATSINIAGPARLRAYVTPENNPVQITTFEARYIEA